MSWRILSADSRQQVRLYSTAVQQYEALLLYYQYYYSRFLVLHHTMNIHTI